MAYARQHAKLDVREEVLQPVRPGGREQRLLVPPQDRGRHGQTLVRLGGPLGERVRDRAGPRAIPGDARPEGAWNAVDVDEAVELLGREGPSRRAPVLPEVREVR